MPVEGVPGKGHAGEQGAMHPGAEMPVDKVEKVICAVGDERDAGDGGAKVDGALGAGVDAVGEGVADADDEGVGLGGIDGFAALEEFRGRRDKGVAVHHVDCLGRVVADGGGREGVRAPFERVGERDLVG